MVAANRETRNPELGTRKHLVLDLLIALLARRHL